MKYRITDIENFVATSACRTILEGARKLGITQPAVSESLKRLESDVGCVLFYRSRTGIQLTPGGKLFLKKANRVLEALSDLNEADDQKSIFSGKTITIGCHATVAQYVMPKALLLIAEQAPDYKIRLHHDLSRHIQTDVQRGNIDIGIVVNPVEVPDIVLKKIGTDVVSVWSTKKDFDQTTIICNPTLFQTQHILRRWKHKPVRIIETDSLELICRLTQAGLGYGIIPSRAVPLTNSKLENVDSLPNYKDEIFMVSRPEFGDSKAESLVADAIRKSLG